MCNIVKIAEILNGNLSLNNTSNNAIKRTGVTIENKIRVLYDNISSQIIEKSSKLGLLNNTMGCYRVKSYLS